MEVNKDIYSPYKAGHHINSILKLRNNEQPVPLQAQIIISDLCNQDCSFCGYRMSGYTSNQNFGEIDPLTNIINNNPNRMISFDKCIEIINDCASMGIKAIQYTGGGEPTVHPKHVDIFQHTIDNGLDLALVTNGAILRDGMPQILAKSAWVRFSIDSSNEKTYSSVRRTKPTIFYRVLDNIKTVVDARNTTKDSKLVIGVGFVVTKDNWHEVYDAIKLYSTLGIDNVRISAVFTQNDFEYHSPHFDRTSELINLAINDFNSDRFQVINLYGDRISDLNLHNPDYNFCPYMHFTTYIGGDLNVYTCCVYAYNDRGRIGSIKEQSFKELWSSQQKEKFCNNFNASHCERCMFNNKNKFINYLIQNNPPHVNFV